VAHGGAEIAAGAGHRPPARGEDDGLALPGLDGLAPRLGPRPLLDEQERASLMIEARPGEEARELEREGHLTVEVLVQAVVATGLIVEQQRRRPGLAGPPAEGEQAVEIGGVAPAGAQGLLPAVGDRGQRRVEARP
jgi:hypothetical protein